MRFNVSTFLVGGEKSGVAAPDNIAIDRKGNLWVTTDIADESIGKGEYESFGNNSLFFYSNER